MATSIIPSIPLYTTHYPLPLYQAAANVPATAMPANLAMLPDATTQTAATTSAESATSTTSASLAQTNTDLSQLLNLAANDALTSVGSLIDLTT